MLVRIMYGQTVPTVCGNITSFIYTIIGTWWQNYLWQVGEEEKWVPSGWPVWRRTSDAACAWIPKSLCRLRESRGVMVMRRHDNTVTGAQKESDLPNGKCHPIRCYQPYSGQVFILTSMTHMWVISEMSSQTGFDFLGISQSRLSLTWLLL